MECCGYLLHDQHTGDEICLGCGKIFAQLTNTTSSLRIYKPNAQLKDVCANNNISNAIEEDALWEIGQSTQAIKSCFVAFCLYNACKRGGASRTLQEIGKMFDIDTATIAQYETVPSREICPSELAGRVCNELGITNFKLVQAVKTFADILSLRVVYSCPAQSALALALCFLPDLASLGKNKVQISKACSVTPSCLRRLSRIYKADILAELSEYYKHSKGTDKDML